MTEKTRTTEKIWSHCDNTCVVIMNHNSGCRCGYVGIGPEHPLYGKSYEQQIPDSLFPFWEMVKQGSIGKRGIIDLFLLDPEKPNVGVLFDVHGGITYSDGSDNYPIETTGVWWFGFDCAHAGDGRDIEQIFPEFSRAYQRNFCGDIVRSLDYCISECESLSEQMARILEGIKSGNTKPKTSTKET